MAPAIVVLKVSAPRAFDGGQAGDAVATGFVVDAKRGLILTNRHVVMPGPVTAKAVFLDNEEVDVRALYRDPVHDFGFYQFNPKDVRFMPLAELSLAPERAEVGLDIRVIGNDAGEKMSILAGTIARLDRAAPVYGRRGFNDFNTFYLQAASGTSGGSSGSPVIDRKGQVVALNAGGRRLAASSFFLPLDRVERALREIQAGRSPVRGTLETVFVYRPYDELRRLGLSASTEEAVRRNDPEGTGLIVVSEIVPGGPADGRLEPGDIVLRIAGERVDGFLPIEQQLDAHVGEKVLLEIERGGQPLSLALEVADLHAVTPSAFFEFGGGILHDLSYQQARNHGVRIQGVYVASPGYTLSRAGLSAGAIVTHVKGVPTPNLEAFENEIVRYADGEKVPVGYWLLDAPRAPGVAVIRVDRRWFSMQHCERNDESGTWPCRPSPPPPDRVAPEPVTTQVTSAPEKVSRALAPSLVMVEYDIPYRIDGVHGDQFRGAGLVVDADRGLVVVDRETVPVALGDLEVVVAGSVRIPAEVVYLHPEHNLAVIRYDPVLIGETPLRSARLREDELELGERVFVVGLSSANRIVSRETRLEQREAVVLPPTYPPRFQESNLELLSVEDAPVTLGGVLADAKGRVRAFWGSFSEGFGQSLEAFFAGIPSREISAIVDPLREGQDVGWRSLDVEFYPVGLEEARSRGLDAEQAARLEKHDPDRRQVLAVRRVTAGGPADGKLRPGDLVLSVDDRPVSRFHEIQQASSAERVGLQILRDGRLLGLTVPTAPLEGQGTTRALIWAGTLLQDPPRVLSRQEQLPREGVYIARYWYGSPADRYGLPAAARILAVDGKPTPDLEAFTAAVRDKPSGASVRLKLEALNGQVSVVTLELDLDYWPSYQ
ncbi:trypsin-like peptidase domain-containing protein, partial [Myxococcota bacterium]|nr:trypsin-like peptidase domain-containing protein [Myxococcota bacterium]